MNSELQCGQAVPTTGKNELTDKNPLVMLLKKDKINEQRITMWSSSVNCEQKRTYR